MKFEEWTNSGVGWEWAGPSGSLNIPPVVQKVFFPAVRVKRLNSPEGVFTRVSFVSNMKVEVENCVFSFFTSCS